MAPIAIGYLTDVEGNYDYFQKYVERSSVLFYDKEKTTLSLKDDAMFVFGGDVCDKGIGSIRIAKQLVALKKKYPERVILIVGNRDVNKMRWTSELEQAEITNVDKVPGPYWVKPEVRVSPKQFLTKLVEAEHGPQPSATQLQQANTIPNRVKWMLDATMGSAGDFDRRRQELAIIQGKQGKEALISEDEVAKSYINSVKPGGEMFDFLHLGQLAYIHEETLFIHGGVTKESMGYVPFASERNPNIVEWVKQLNAWYLSEVLEWAQHPTWLYAERYYITKVFTETKFDPSIQAPVAKELYEDKKNWGARGAHRLLDYVVPGTIGSVIYTNMLNKFNNCQLADPNVGRRLNEFGIRRVVSGHQPHGYAPAVAKDGYLEVIDADTSYSDMTVKDNRGKAVSEVLIKGKNVYVQGVNSNGVELKYHISLVEGEGDPYIGKRVVLPDDRDDNGYWVKAKYATKQAGKDYVICKVNGFVVSYSEKSEDELEDLLPTIKSAARDRARASFIDIKTVKIHNQEIPITKSQGVEPFLKDIVRVPFFVAWAHRLAPDLTLHKIEIQSVDIAGPQIRFIKLNAHITNKSGQVVPSVTFLRGDSVSILLVLTVVENGKKRKLAVVVRHTRSPIGTVSHFEIPVGLDEGTPLGAIRNLMEVEVGIELEFIKPVNMNEVLYGYDKPIFMSPGSSDEGMRCFLVESTISVDQIRAIEKKATENPLIAPELVPIEDLAAKCNDAKSLLAAQLYELYQMKLKNK